LDWGNKRKKEMARNNDDADADDAWKERIKLLSVPSLFRDVELEADSIANDLVKSQEIMSQGLTEDEFSPELPTQSDMDTDNKSDKDKDELDLTRTRVMVRPGLELLARVSRFRRARRRQISGNIAGDMEASSTFTSNIAGDDILNNNQRRWWRGRIMGRRRQKMME
jgi:hypothetical protein